MDRLGEKLMMKDKTILDNVSTTREVSTGSVDSLCEVKDLKSACGIPSKKRREGIQTVEVHLGNPATHTPRLQHSTTTAFRTLSKVRKGSPSIGGPAGRSSTRCSTPTGKRNSAQPSPSPRFVKSQRSQSVDVVSIVTQSVSRMMNNNNRSIS